MKRKIEVSTPHLTITAVLNTRKALTRDEVERARDHLADSLMRAAADVTYMQTPINRVKVK